MTFLVFCHVDLAWWDWTRRERKAALTCVVGDASHPSCRPMIIQHSTLFVLYMCQVRGAR